MKQINNSIIFLIGLLLSGLSQIAFAQQGNLPCNSVNSTPFIPPTITGTLSQTTSTAGVGAVYWESSAGCVLGLPLGCGSTRIPANVINSSTTDFARVNLAVGLGLSATMRVTEATNTYSAGDFAGYLIDNASLVSAGLLSAITVKTYNNGTLAETSSAGSLVGVSSSLVAGKYEVGLYTTLPFDAIEITFSSVVGLAVSYDVYYPVVKKYCAGPALPCNTSAILSEPTYPLIATGGVSGLLCVGCSVGNLSNAIDASTTNYADMTLLVGAGTTAYMSIKDPLTDYAANTFAGMDIENTGLLGLNLFSGMTLTTYLNGVQQETKSGSGQLISAGSSLLGGTGRQTVGFITTLPFDEIKLSMASLVGVSLGTTRVYGAIFEKFCAATIACNQTYSLTNPTYPVLIDGGLTGVAGLVCVGCSVTNADNLLTASATDYATITVVAGLASSASIAVQDALYTYPMGTSLGFTIKDANTLLQADLFGGITVSTYNNGVLQETKTATAVLDLAVVTNWVGLGSGAYNVGFTATLPFDEVRLTIGSLLSALNVVRVYGAFINTTTSYGGSLLCASTFNFDCVGATSTGTFTANGTGGQTGSLTIPITGTTVGSTIFKVTGTGFTASYTTALAAGQTSVTIPITYNGGGSAGTRTLTVTSISGTGSCTPSVTVVPANGSACIASVPILLPLGLSLSIPTFCVKGNYNYYRNAASSNQDMLAINTNGNSFNPVDIIVDASNSGVHSISNAFGITALAHRMTSIQAPGSYTVNGGMKIRLYYDTTELASLPAGTRRWFKHTAHTKAGVLADLTASELANAILLTPDSTGFENGLSFVEFSNVQSFSTFGVIVSALLCPTPSVGGTTATVTPTVCGATNSGTITLSGQTGSVTTWQTSINGGTSWTDIVNTTTSLSFTNAVNNQQYRAVVNNSGACVDDNSSATTITVSIVAAPTTTITQPTCSVATGTITVNTPASGVTYSFDNGVTFQASNIKSGLAAATTYQVVVKDDVSGCASTATPSVINAVLGVSTISSVVKGDPSVSSCPAANDGTITVMATGSNLQYSIDNGITYQASNSFTGLIAGSYTIKVKDNVSTCEIAYTSNPVVLTAPVCNIAPTITSAAIATTPENVTTSMPVYTAMVIDPDAGQSQTYSFETGGVDNAKFNIAPLTGAVTFIASPNFELPTDANGDNIYDIKIKACDNGTPQYCGTKDVAIVVTNIVVECNTVGGTAAYTGGTGCSTSNMGTITLTGQTGNVITWQTSTNGGTSWTDIAGTLNKTMYNFINAVNNQQFRAVVNANIVTCSDDYSSVVTITTSATACTTTTCSYTSDSFSPTISTSSNPTYTTQVVLVNPTTGAITNVTAANSTAFTGVTLGDYVMYAVTYDNTMLPIPTLTVGTNISALTGCFTVSNPLLTKVCCPTIVAPTVTITQPSCGVTTGSITVTNPLSGATYSFDNGATFQASATKSGVTASTTYQVLTKDDVNACLSAATPSVINAALTVPSAPITTVVQPTCSVTTGTITITSPATGVTYSFDNGTTFQAAATSNALTSGTYQVVVKGNVSNCVSTATPSVIDAILAVPAMPTATMTQPTCSVATGTITITSPATGVTYSFDNGVSYQVSATSSALVAGVYKVLVKDNSSGCTSSATPVTILSMSPPPVPTLSVTQPVCFAKIGDITITAPTEVGMTYSIDGIDYSNTTGIFTGVLSGTYNVTAEAANGCVSSSASAFMNPQLVTPKVGIIEATCVVPTGTLVVTIPLGIGFSYSLDQVDYSNTTGVFPGLFAGAYSVTAKNVSGCTAKSVLLVVNPSVPPSVIEVNQPNCTTPTGTITVTSPLTTVLYSFDYGLTFQSSNILTNATAGSYLIVLKNISDGCQGLAKTVTVNAAPTVGCSCSNTTGTITSTISTQNTSAAYTQEYVLTDNDGVIIQTSTTPTFTGLTSNQYAIYAINYKTTEGVTGLTIGQNIAGVSGSSLAVSVPLFYQVCLPVFSCNNLLGNITAVVSGQNTNANFTQSYALTDSVDVILKLSNTPSFTGLAEGRYKLYGVNYETASGVTGLTIGQNITLVTGSCFNKTTPLLYQVCIVPEICNNRIDDDGDGLIDCEDVTDCPSCGCDNSTGNITFTNTGQSTTGYTQVYVLTDSTAKILKLSNTPTFTGLPSGRYRVYAVNYRTADGITGLTIGASANAITGTCFDKSLPLLFKVCLCVTFDFKVFLEGPYQQASQTMKTILNQRGLLPGQTPIGQFAVQTPQGQPYKGAPWNYSGTEGDTITTYPATVVDWVLITLRKDTTTTDNVFRVTGWLHNDGHISFISPCFEIANGSYYVLIEHRNHVGVMSPSKALITNGVMAHDFTMNDSYVLINPPSFGQKQKGARWVMYGGDGKKDTFTNNYDVNFFDSQLWKLQSGVFDQYRFGDFNMDADVNFSDNNLWKFNSGKYSTVPH